MLSITILAAIMLLAQISDTQFQHKFLTEICSGLLTTIFILQTLRLKHFYYNPSFFFCQTFFNIGAFSYK